MKHEKKICRGLFSIPVDLLISPIALACYIGGRFFSLKLLYQIITAIIADYARKVLGAGIEEISKAF